MKQEPMKDYSTPFAAWELRLYLDTHPEDERALALYRQLCASGGSKCNYACATPDAAGGSDVGGCRDAAGGRVWSWISDPWPWEVEANACGGNK